MARRVLVAAVSLAAVIAGCFAPAPVSADADACGSGLLIAGSVGGTVGRGDDEDWWFHLAVPGSYVVTLVSGPSDADLVVGDGACGTLCESSEGLGRVDVCTATTTDHGLTIGITSLAKTLDAAYVVTVAPLAPAATATACSDNQDNDTDGAFDFPADPGCSSRQDDTEDSGDCNTVGGSEVCSALLVGAERDKLVAEGLDETKYEIAGYVDVYRFRAAGVRRDVACTVLVLKPQGTFNPCKAAGAAFVDRVKQLYRVTPDGPEPPLEKVTYVRVCDAELTLTVDGRGLNALPIVTTC